MGIVTRGMGVIMKGAKKRKTLSISTSVKPTPPPRPGEVIIKKKSKPSKTKLSDTWQGRRVQAMNRIIKKHPNIRGYTRAQTERFIDEYGKVSSSTAKTKKEYKGKK
jgi:hypothetical protein